MSEMDTVLAAAERALDKSLERLFELLRIPSVSTDPTFDGDCRKAAQWIVDELNGIGFDASVRETGGKPMVVAHGGPKPDGTAPHVMFYGHYDVQPADPLELWETDPFEPRLVDAGHGKEIVARGACDDKGQFMTFVEALRHWHEAGGIPLPVTLLIEGEEECGSGSLQPFLEANRDELKSDVAFICDTTMWDRQTPGITTMLRGLLYEEITVTAANRDLHSGMYGGAAANPINILARLIASLHDENGAVTVPGFYDDVPELPAETKAQWDGLGFSAEHFLGEIGLKVPAGETGRSALEQIWSRPTCDANGIIGGYTGAGSKTVIASKASAKISFRLVGRQDPVKLREAFRDFIRAQVPADCTVEFHGHAANPPLVMDIGRPEIRQAAAALEAEFGKAPAMMGSGGSIPIPGHFERILGMGSILIGFGLDDDRIHSPNEKYDLSSFRHGIGSWVRIIGALSGRA